MTTAEIAIVVTGFVGLGAPIVSHIFEARREDRRIANESAREKLRLDHERDLRDRDALRMRLDLVAEAIDSTTRAMGALYHAVATEGPESARLRPMATNAWQALNDAQLANAKLALWIDPDDSIGVAAYECLHANEYIVTKLDFVAGLKRYPEGFSFDDLDAHTATSLEAARRYLREAREQYGVRKE